MPPCLPCVEQEVVAFKIPSYEVEKHPERLFTHWCAGNSAAFFWPQQCMGVCSSFASV